MFWLQSQNTCFDQCLDFVFEDIAPASRMMNHPMEKTIVGSFVRPTSSGRLASGNLSLSPLLSKWKSVTTCSSLKEYYLWYSEVLLELPFFDRVSPYTFNVDCNAPIPRVRKRYCDVYTQGENILIYIRSSKRRISRADQGGWKKIGLRTDNR